MIKVRILRTHYRAEDCRTMHHLLKDQIIEASEQFAGEILADRDGVRVVEQVKVEEPKAVIEAPENKMISSADLENKSIIEPTSSEVSIGEKITNKFNQFKKRKK